MVCRSGQTTLEECGIENWATDKAQDRMDNLLTAYYSDGTCPDIILSPNDSIAMGIVNSLKNAGFTDPDNFPCITGQDCDIANMKLMVEGFIAHNIFKNTKELAKLTVEAVAAHYDGKEPVVNGEYDNNTIIVPAQYLALTEITPENWYQELVVNAEYYTLEELGLTEADIPQ